MSKLIGLILIAAGFGFAFDLIPLEAMRRQVGPVSVAAEVASKPAIHAAANVATASQPRVFAPGQPLIAAQMAARRAGSAGDLDPIRIREVLPLKSGPTLVSRTAEPAPIDPTSLVRALQQELTRVGCYAGEIDGDWGVGSKRAMRAFTERVNAMLPTEAPDLVLLSLVRGHGERVCGSDCEPGHILSSRGHCVRRGETTANMSGAGAWRPVAKVATAAPATVVAPSSKAKTEVRRVVASPPQLVTAPTPVARIVSAAPDQPRSIDWTTRMSVGAPLAAIPAGVIPVRPSVAVPPPASPLTAARAPVALNPLTQQTAPAVRRPTPPARRSRERYASRPAYIDQPRPRPNWKQSVFVSSR